MQLPALFVEYLINGSVALIWVLPFLNMMGYSLPQNASFITLFVPGIYVLGMIVDFMGWFLVHSYKYRMKRNVYNELNYNSPSIQGESHIPEAQSLLYAPELEKAFAMRSSKDRIARGSIINAALITIIFTFHSWQTGKILLATMTTIGGIAMTFICVIMWSRFQRLSYKFVVESMKILEEKIMNERTAKLHKSNKIDEDIKHDKNRAK